MFAAEQQHEEHDLQWQGDILCGLLVATFNALHRQQTAGKVLFLSSLRMLTCKSTLLYHPFHIVNAIRDSLEGWIALDNRDRPFCSRAIPLCRRIGILVAHQ